MIKLRKLQPAEELQYLKEIHGKDNYPKLFAVLIGHFDVLQSRAQMLLSLIAICMTVTGFSGPSIAKSGLLAKGMLIFGLSFVLISSLLLVLGPLQLRWGTQRRGVTVDESITALIERRNVRTIKYHMASALLVIGLAGYVGSLIVYMLGV
jgi:hypothetical protein